MSGAEDTKKNRIWSPTSEVLIVIEAGGGGISKHGQRNSQRDLEGRRRPGLSLGDPPEFVKGGWGFTGTKAGRDHGGQGTVGAPDILSRQPRLKGRREAGKDGSGS